MVSSPTTRRTRSRIDASAATNNSPSSNDEKGRKATATSAITTTMKKNAASPTANDDEGEALLLRRPSMKKNKAAAMETDKIEAINNNAANNNNNNNAAADSSTGGKNNESRNNDGPANKAAAASAAANNDAASTDNTEASTDTTSSSPDNDAPLNPVGGAMSVDTITTAGGGASTSSEKGAQQQQPFADSGAKLSLAEAPPPSAIEPDGKAENDSNIIDNTVLIKESLGTTAHQQLQHPQQREGKPTAQNAVIATANTIVKATTEPLPFKAATAAASAATASKLTSENSTNDANATTSSNNNNSAATSENNSSSSSSSSPNSFSMTLAIGPSDTKRLFMASKTFNEEIQKLKSNKNANHNSNDHGGGGPPTTTASDKEGESLEKKRKAADSDTTMSDASSTSNNVAAAVAAAAAAIVQSSPSSPSIGATTTIPSSKAATTLSTHDQIALLITAAKSTSNPLLSSFMSKMKHKHTEEQETSLLFFLDADKSTKLLMAFDVLSEAKKVGGGGGNNEDKKGGAAAAVVVASTATKDKKGGVNDTLAAMAIDDVVDGVDESKVLSRRGLTLLFQSFLTSISTCVHNKSDNGKSSSSSSSSSPQEENKSPNSAAAGGSSGGDWTGSEKTAKEISEVAIFAANHLIEYAKKEGQGGGKQSAVDPSVSFDQFGKWYNSGGFSLVPWLELLDLSKWDYTLKTNKNVAIEQVPLGGGGVTATTTTPNSVKRAKFDDTLTPLEAIGSPTGLFETGAAVGATPQPLPSKPNGVVQSFSAMFGEPTQSRNVVSFDFSGTAAGAFHIDITEENLVMLRQLVTRTGFASLTPQHVESVILKHSRCERRKYGDTVYVISRQQFNKFIRDVVPKDASKNFDPNEIENFSNYFTNFFTCFDYNWSDLKKDEVNAKELMVGFSFLCAGNKSSKLAAAYDMLDVDKNGYLTQRGLMQYLRAYLTMLAGISLLSSNKKTTTQIRKQLMSAKRNEAFLAVENGAKWTLGHFFRAFEAEHARSGSTRNNAVAFEDFAKWYTEGGYAVAPWLELLDLQKFLSLIGDFQPPQQPQPTAGPAQASLADVLFTFPLAKERSLVVLRDDAHYVRAVVSEMGLLSLTSEDIWATLSKDVTKKLGAKKSAVIPVDQASFVECMMKILSESKKPTHKSSWANFSPEETLKNFFLSFDLMQVNQVPLNQLMCGLTLLCGGKKSSKLGFAFGLFCGDGKNGKKKIQTMGHDDFIQFFRSFLIVMFSCCNQSLSLSADTVSQYISDTAQAVADAVMAYWNGKKVDKVKFDHFSKWYNEGGFQMAPWLELLDLHKWVLADDEPVPAAAPSAPVPAQSKNAAAVPLVHAPINARDIFNTLVASPDPKDMVSNMAPSPNDSVPPPPDDDLLLNLVDDDVDMVSLLEQ